MPKASGLLKVEYVLKFSYIFSINYQCKSQLVRMADVISVRHVSDDIKHEWIEWEVTRIYTDKIFFSP